MKKWEYYFLGYWVLVVAMLAVLSCLTGCRTKYVPTPEYHFQEVTKTLHDTLRDSVRIHDSVVVLQRGDTVYHTAWKVRETVKYKSITATDTVVRVDSIRVPYPVERELSWWEKTKINVYKSVFFVFTGIFLIFAVSYLPKLIKWIRTKIK